MAPNYVSAMWSVVKNLLIKPAAYASVYSASAAAVSLAALSAPQFAAVPALAKAVSVFAISSTSFGVGSAHGSFAGLHRLLIDDRALLQLLPTSKLFDFFKGRDVKRLDMEVSTSAPSCRLHA